MQNLSGSNEIIVKLGCPTIIDNQRVFFNSIVDNNSAKLCCFKNFSYHRGHWPSHPEGGGGGGCALDLYLDRGAQP